MLRSTHHDLREKIKFPAAVSCSRLLRRPTSSHTVFASRSRFPGKDSRLRWTPDRRTPPTEGMDSLSLAGPPCRISEDKVGGALSCGKVRQRQNILSGSGGRLAAGDRKPFLSHRGSRVPGLRTDRPPLDSDSDGLKVGRTTRCPSPPCLPTPHHFVLRVSGT